MEKVKGKMRHKVPVHNFPQGRWKAGKIPRGLFMMYTLQLLGMCFLWILSKWITLDIDTHKCLWTIVQGLEVIPLNSRSQVGWAFAEFCSRHFTPLILIRDNIGEHIGGSLMEECQR
jgi:hypothetical protein